MNEWPREVTASVKRAEDLIRKGNPVDLVYACDALDDALSYLPDDPILIIVRGKILMHLGDTESANNDFKKAGAHKPEYATALLKPLELGGNFQIFKNMFITIDDMPPVFHITHWKAGSQWVRKILHDCFPEHLRIPYFDPKKSLIEFEEFCDLPIKNGAIYSPLYIGSQMFDRMSIPPKWKRFVIIRDLRDTLISGYFSFKKSHPLLTRDGVELRSKLESMDIESGLMYSMDTWLHACAYIQASWIENGEELIKYEDLLSKDVEILSKVLIDKCGLPISNERLGNIIIANRFEAITGRKPGQEDIESHMRRGTKGNWRNHFTENLKKIFKEHFGDLIIKTGYERDYNW
jgi:lipopolysaccharide transport system ATP-binding protein